MNRNNAGAVSIILCFVFLALIIAVGAAGDVSGLAAANAYAHRINYLSCKSVLAEYDRNLFDDYGLLAFAGGADEIEERIDDYSSMMRRVNRKPGDETVFFDVMLKDVSVDCRERNLRNPSVFMEQIKEYMKYCALENGIEGFLGLPAGKPGFDSALNNALDSFDKEAQDKTAGENSGIEEGNPGVGAGGDGGEARNPVDVNDSRSDTAVDCPERVLRSRRIIDSLPSGADTAGNEKGEYLLGKEKDLLELGADSSEFLDSFYSSLSGGADRFILCEYIMNRFKNTVNLEKVDGDTFFTNEVEYILKGGFDDRKNASSVKRDLFLLRTALNIAHIYTDPEKSRITLEAAAAAGPYAAAVQFVFIAAWAGAEAQEDINTLYSGGKVSFIKSSSDWKLDFDSVFGEGKVINSAYRGDNGLEYSGYLRLLLLTRSRDDLIERTMDLIQINMKGRYNIQFDLRNCCTGFAVHTEYERLWYLPAVLPGIVEDNILSYEEMYEY